MAAGIRLARDENAPALDQVLEDAFFDEPLNDWLLPNTARRHAALQKGMGHVLREIYLRHGGAWTTEELEGVAMWGKPSDPKPSALQQMRGLPAFVATFRQHLPRALKAFDSVEKRRPTDPHWFLDILAVRPDRQGQGIGSALIKVGLDEADRARVPAFLGTSNPRNLPLYMRHGFVVEEEYNVGPVRVWVMLRRVA